MREGGKSRGGKSRGGKLPYEKSGIIVGKFQLNPSKEIILGVAQALFDPWLRLSRNVISARRPAEF